MSEPQYLNVTGTGSAVFDGTYNLNGSFKGLPRWSKADGSVDIVKAFSVPWPGGDFNRPAWLGDDQAYGGYWEFWVNALAKPGMPQYEYGGPDAFIAPSDVTRPWDASWQNMNANSVQRSGLPTVSPVSLVLDTVCTGECGVGYRFDGTLCKCVPWPEDPRLGSGTTNNVPADTNTNADVPADDSGGGNIFDDIVNYFTGGSDDDTPDTSGSGDETATTGTTSTTSTPQTTATPAATHAPIIPGVSNTALIIGGIAALFLFGGGGKK